MYLLILLLLATAVDGIIYKVSVIHNPPLVYIAGNLFSGYAVDLIHEVAKMEGWDVELVEVKDGKSGARNDTDGSWDGLVGELLRGEVDIILGPLGITAEKAEVLEFTLPWYDTVGTQILMRKRTYRKSIWIHWCGRFTITLFVQLLTGELWGAVMGVFLVIAFLIWLFSFFSPYSYRNRAEQYKDDPEKRDFGVLESIWFCASSLTPQGGGDPPKNASGQVTAGTWWVFVFIIIASYTANMAAFLTSARLNKGIQSVADLGKQYDIQYAPVEASDSARYFQTMSDVEIHFYKF